MAKRIQCLSNAVRAARANVRTNAPIAVALRNAQHLCYCDDCGRYCRAAEYSSNNGLCTTCAVTS